MERTADNSVGNVTGSNSVNVFLGLGLPWTMAAIYHYIVNVSTLEHVYYRKFLCHQIFSQNPNISPLII